MVKERDLMAWLSSKHPTAHTMSSYERAEIVCDNGNTWGANCTALRKNWLGIRIARRKGEEDMLIQAMQNINDIQRSMGIRVTRFEELQ